MARTLVAQRRAAAEEVCWTLVIMMTLGGLEIPMDWRFYLAPYMQEWSALAVKTGIMKSDEEEKP